jgi:hypothetical protein
MHRRAGGAEAEDEWADALVDVADLNRNAGRRRTTKMMGTCRHYCSRKLHKRVTQVSYETNDICEPYSALDTVAHRRLFTYLDQNFKVRRSKNHLLTHDHSTQEYSPVLG